MKLSERLANLWAFSKHGPLELAILRDALGQDVQRIFTRLNEVELAVKRLREDFKAGEFVISNMSTRLDDEAEALRHSIATVQHRLNKLECRKSKEQVCHDILRSAGKAKDLRDVLAPLQQAVEVLEQLQRVEGDSD